MEKTQFRKFQAFDEDHSSEVLPQEEEKPQEKTAPSAEEGKTEVKKEEEQAKEPILLFEYDEKEQENDKKEEEPVETITETSTEVPKEEIEEERTDTEKTDSETTSLPNESEEKDSNPEDLENSWFIESKDEEEEKPSFRQLFTKEMAALVWRLGLLTFICLMIILATLYWISPLNTLEKIVVYGNEKVETNAILKSSGLKKDGPLWSQVLNKNEAAQKIKKNHKELKDVSISFEPLNQLDIKLEEYQVDALLKEGGTYHPILENGYVRKEETISLNADYPVLENFKDEKIIFNFLTAYHELSEEIAGLIDEIHYTGNAKDPNQITLIMSDGNQVIARISTLTKYLPKYPQVAAQMKEKGVVDMEAGVFSYPYGNEEKNKAKESQNQNANQGKENTTQDNVEGNTEEKKEQENNFIPDITQLPGQKEKP